MQCVCFFSNFLLVYWVGLGGGGFFKAVQGMLLTVTIQAGVTVIQKRETVTQTGDAGIVGGGGSKQERQ